MNWKFWNKTSDAREAELSTGEAELSMGEQLKSLAQNLITLEINTIVKENMIGGPMPTIPNALVEIASSYLRAFARYGIDITEVYELRDDTALEAIKLPRYDPPDSHDKYFAFEDYKIKLKPLFVCLNRAARQAQTQFAPILADKQFEEQRLTLRRIEDNSDKLRQILEGNALGAKAITREQLESRKDILVPVPPLTLRDQLAIKKIWEVGSERIVAQTVIQLDGDVVTRLPSDLGSIADAQLLMDLHQKGLFTAIGRWESLMNAAIAVITGLTRPDRSMRRTET